MENPPQIYKCILDFRCLCEMCCNVISVDFSFLDTYGGDHLHLQKWLLINRKKKASQTSSVYVSKGVDGVMGSRHWNKFSFKLMFVCDVAGAQWENGWREELEPLSNRSMTCGPAERSSGWAAGEPLNSSNCSSVLTHIIGSMTQVCGGWIAVVG